MHGWINVILVFGCGGDRDTEKRQPMGIIASKYANYIIVTDDNPRSENAGNIRKQVLAYCPNAREIPDRRDAISTAISMLKQMHNAVVLIAGKGHEQFQIIGESRIPFSDIKVVQELCDIGA